MGFKCNFIFLFSITLIHTTISIRTPPVINGGKSLEEIILFHANDTELKINCNASGNPAPTYKWKLNGQEVRDNVNNATGELIIKNRTDKAKYQCFASNTWGLAKSNLVVLRKIDFNESKIEEKIATVGKPFKLNCNVSIDFLKNVNSNWTVEVSKNDNSTVGNKILDPNGNLWFSNVTTNDINKIYVYKLHSGKNSYPVCKITLRDGESDPPFKFAEPENFYVTGKDETAVWNETKKLYCIYYHENHASDVTIKWTKDKENVTSKAKESGKYIEIGNFKPKDEGEYQCEVFLNGELKFNHTISLKIGTPYFEFKNESEIVYGFENETASINFEVGGFPKPEINFTHNDITIVKLDDLYFNQMIFNTSGNNHSINITNLSVKHTGRYGFYVYNKHGFVYKDIFLSVGSKHLTVTRNESEMSSSSDEGKNITLKCPVKSFPPAKIQWMKLINGTDNTNVSNADTLIWNDDLWLTIYNLNIDDAGNYTCSGENDGNKVSATLTLNVTVTPRNHTDSTLTTSSSPPKPTPNPALLIIILVVVALVIIIAVVIMYRKSSESGEYQAAASVEMGSEPGTSESSNPKRKTAHTELATAEV